MRALLQQSKTKLPNRESAVKKKKNPFLTLLDLLLARAYYFSVVVAEKLEILPTIRKYEGVILFCEESMGRRP